MTGMLMNLLLPDIPGLYLDDVLADKHCIRLFMSTQTSPIFCPHYGQMWKNPMDAAAEGHSRIKTLATAECFCGWCSVGNRIRVEED